VSITCPEIAREVLRKQDANFISRPLTFASETFSGGYRNAVLSPYGDQWKKMRRVLTSEIICPSRHAWLHDKRVDEADNLTRYVYNLATAAASSGAVVDVRYVARHYCGNVIRRLMFNRRYFGEPQPDGGPGPMEVLHMDAVFTSLGLLYAFCVSDYLPWLRGLDLDGHEKIVKEANETVNRLHDTVIDDRWRQWKSGERQEMEDFLDVLITLKDAQGNPPLTIEEVKAQSQVKYMHAACRHALGNLYFGTYIYMKYIDIMSSYRMCTYARRTSRSRRWTTRRTPWSGRWQRW
jgi:tyrosine N-monooxygenase